MSTGRLPRPLHTLLSPITMAAPRCGSRHDAHLTSPHRRGGIHGSEGKRVGWGREVGGGVGGAWEGASMGFSACWLLLRTHSLA